MFDSLEYEDQLSDSVETGMSFSGDFDAAQTMQMGSLGFKFFGEKLGSYNIQIKCISL